ncbi:GNAT family N-acetyltransferase [Mesonia sp.]|uniref:GNAT family N-acetyltransferase n=1 Tax=Mesonia sp. TaxID=1960830 RepID=UPI0017561C50|nr:GNAT family N-acetyltransferase [Mesonia sp.]HIB35971.1 GNAT family N-acetyltransferase [Mesonia sp.]
MSYKIKLINNPEDEFWHQFDEIIKNCEHTVQFNSVWLSNYIENYLDEKQNVLILAAYQEEKLVGCLPVQTVIRRGTRFYNYIELIPLGFGPTDFYYIPLIKDDNFKILEKIVDYLISEVKWDKIRLSELPENSIGFNTLLKVLSSKNIKFQKKSENGFRFIKTINKNAEDFLEKDFYPHNKDLAKSERRIDRKGFKLSYKHYKKNVYQELLKNIELYAQRRESLGQLNKYETSKRKAFLKNIIEKYEALNKVELTLLLANEEVWAFQLDWIDNNNRYHWNHAYNEDYKRYSPGKVILKHLLIQGINDQDIKTCNHMRGLSRYKEKFTDQQVNLYTIDFENPRSYKIKFTRFISSTLRLVGKK